MPESPERALPERPWTPGPWQDMPHASGDTYQGMEGVEVLASYSVDGGEAIACFVPDRDDIAWPGIGDTSATAQLIALAPRMAEAILAFWDCSHPVGLPEDCACSDALHDVDTEIRAIAGKP